MQRHAYLIMAYSEYEQLNVLLQMLDYERNDIYVHIDKKNSMPEREELCKNVKYSNVYLYHKYSVYWGHFSQTECEVFLLQEATKQGYDYYHLLSGMDLPLCSQKEMHKFFEENEGKEFVRFWAESFPEKCYDWIRLYHPLQKYLRIGKNPKLNSMLEKTAAVLDKVQKVFGVDRLKKENISFQKGATWFSITNQFANLVVEKKDWIYKVFRSTRSSDEIFLQTILNNSEYLEKRFEITYETDGLTGLRYIDWKRGKPYIFRKGDYDELLNCGFLFARKFNMSVDREIVELLYKKIINDRDN